MTVPWPAATLAGGGIAAGLALAVLKAVPRAFLVENRSGSMVPATLGWALMGGFLGGAAIGVFLTGMPGGRDAVTVLLGCAGAGLLFWVGLVDDLRGHGPRGLVGHLRSLFQGRLTTGILKLLVGAAIGIGLAIWLGGGTVRVVASSVLIVVSINLWNAFDVAPGRALKWGIVVLGVVLATAVGRTVAVLVGAGLGAAAGILFFDVRERGMLGDAGSNPLGLLGGLGLAVILPTWGLVAAALVVLALQTLAETVTISRVIEAVPPLRWFDRLGRRARPQPRS
jgi:UDP-GlcNAc:undecaprenyl-phosphate/decaprenyl-phosphate GlcNAc-1-phosphate transferase